MESRNIWRCSARALSEDMLLVDVAESKWRVYGEGNVTRMQEEQVKEGKQRKCRGEGGIPTVQGSARGGLTWVADTKW
eukprot:3492990-Rhodomonas_salina.4